MFGPGRAELRAGDATMVVNGRGFLTSILDANRNRDHKAKEAASPLMSVRIDGEMVPPESFDWDSASGIITLGFGQGIDAQIRAEQQQSYLTLELLSMDPPSAVELVVWGPYGTTVSDTIGETVGVVRDSEFALGIQALNEKTLGGLPWRENDFPPQIDIFEGDDFTDLSEEGRRYVLYRVEAAKPEDFGSTLQAYCRDRSSDRVIENWGHEQYLAPSFDDGGVVGCKIALFGARSRDALETIGRIEVEEGLPHPTIDGEWGKVARTASAAYLILDFSEADIEQAISWTKRAGLRYLYHPEPFRTWGHFELNERFPNGREGLRRCVEMASEQGVYVGVHTLSNFITTNDAYVTPVPDERLARVGESTLAETVDSRAITIPVVSRDVFAQLDNNTLQTVKIGEELVSYLTVSEEEPWQLLDCERGAFGTRATSHETGDTVALLADHAYRVFLTNAELGQEVATNIADLFNDTGLRQISFDGVEGNQSTGMGNYGEILFTSQWYESLSDDIRTHLIADASRTTHFFWHIYTRMNWGEPWYAGFRESQTEYRLKNQPYFRRNYMPGMLGWFRMTEQVSIEDVEWMLARSSAFDAGYAFVTSYEALDGNGFTERILSAIGLWEEARMADVFSADQKRRMEDVSNEFLLSRAGQGTWDLTQVYPQVFRHERGARQPGEPTSSTFEFENPGGEQELHWILSAEDGEVSNPSIAFDTGDVVHLPVRLREGWSARYEGGSTVAVLDGNNCTIRVLNVRPESFRIAAGMHSVTMEANLEPAQEAKARLELRPRGVNERVETQSQ